jgi:hypothetical protein
MKNGVRNDTAALQQDIQVLARESDNWLWLCQRQEAVAKLEAESGWRSIRL